MLGVDTIVLCEGQLIGKPARRRGGRADARAARRPHPRGRLGSLPAHRGLGGARTPRRPASRFRELTPRELGRYLASGEWEGRAGAYAIQGLGALARRADRGRLPERRRAARRRCSSPARRALPRRLRLRLSSEQRAARPREDDQRAGEAAARDVFSEHRPASERRDHDRRGAHGEHRRRSAPPQREQAEHERGERGRRGSDASAGRSPALTAASPTTGG